MEDKKREDTTTPTAMVFPSIPFYLDPSYWLQQKEHNLGGNESPKVVCYPTEGSSSGGPFKAGSMADRARLAKIPNPEAGLKCPRCDSSKTKFCYFNNYNLSQPRHFCKSCRRYWTRGGALRNVPVGGGCRGIKKTKPIQTHTASKAPLSSALDNESYCPRTPSHSSHLSFLSSLNNRSQFENGNVGLNSAGMGRNLGLYSGSSSSLLSTGNHVSFFEPQASFFPFNGEMVENALARSRASEEVKSGYEQRVPLLDQSENSQYLIDSGFSWSDVSELNSASANQLL